VTESKNTERAKKHLRLAQQKTIELFNKGLNKIRKTKDGKDNKLTLQLRKLETILKPKQKKVKVEDSHQISNEKYLFCIINERELFQCIADVIRS